MNTKLVESLIQIIQSLPEEERFLLEQKLAETISYPSANEIEKISSNLFPLHQLILRRLGNLGNQHMTKLNNTMKQVFNI